LPGEAHRAATQLPRPAPGAAPRRRRLAVVRGVLVSGAGSPVWIRSPGITR
jgi:hypothetical protein